MQELETRNLPGKDGVPWPGPGQIPPLGCTASRSPRSSSARGVQNLRAYEARGLLEPPAPTAAPAATAPTTWTGCAASGDLLDAGLNLAGIAMVLDLQDENNQLRAAEKPPRAKTRTEASPLDLSHRKSPSSS